MYSLNDKNQIFREDRLVGRFLDGRLEFEDDDAKFYARGICGFLKRKGLLDEEESERIIAEVAEHAHDDEDQPAAHPRDLDEKPDKVIGEPRPPDDPHQGDKADAVVMWYFDNDREEFFNRYQVIDRNPMKNGKYYAHRTTCKTSRSQVGGTL